MLRQKAEHGHVDRSPWKGLQFVGINGSFSEEATSEGRQEGGEGVSPADIGRSVSSQPTASAKALSNVYRILPSLSAQDDRFGFPDE